MYVWVSQTQDVVGRAALLKTNETCASLPFLFSSFLRSQHTKQKTLAFRRNIKTRVGFASTLIYRNSFVVATNRRGKKPNF